MVVVDGLIENLYTRGVVVVRAILIDKFCNAFLYGTIVILLLMCYCKHTLEDSYFLTRIFPLDEV